MWTLLSFVHLSIPSPWRLFCQWWERRHLNWSPHPGALVFSSELFNCWCISSLRTWISFLINRITEWSVGQCTTLGTVWALVSPGCFFFSCSQAVWALNMPGFSEPDSIPTWQRCVSTIKGNLHKAPGTLAFILLFWNTFSGPGIFVAVSGTLGSWLFYLPGSFSSLGGWGKGRGKGFCEFSCRSLWR